jgi:hypothetical protein
MTVMAALHIFPDTLSAAETAENSAAAVRIFSATAQVHTDPLDWWSFELVRQCGQTLPFV